MTSSTPKISLTENTYEMKKARIVNYTLDTPFHPNLHTNQMLPKIPKGIGDVSAQECVSGRTDRPRLIALFPKPFARG